PGRSEEKQTDERHEAAPCRESLMVFIEQYLVAPLRRAANEPYSVVGRAQRLIGERKAVGNINNPAFVNGADLGCGDCGCTFAGPSINLMTLQKIAASPFFRLVTAGVFDVPRSGCRNDELATFAYPRIERVGLGF